MWGSGFRLGIYRAEGLGFRGRLGLWGAFDSVLEIWILEGSACDVLNPQPLNA